MGQISGSNLFLAGNRMADARRSFVTGGSGGGSLTDGSSRAKAGLQFRETSTPLTNGYRRTFTEGGLNRNGPFSGFDKVSFTSSIKKGDVLTERRLLVERDATNRTERLFGGLQGSLDRLTLSPLSGKTGKSIRDSVARGNPTIDAATGTYSVTVNGLPRSDVAASRTGQNISSPLGLSGSIKVNGYSITVDSTDSLASIAEKINRGEDSNYDGQLTKDEDTNGNGQLDIIQSRGVYTGDGYTPGFYLNEDANGNGAIDSSEDSNGNDRLDGGTKETKARAFVTNDQLIIESLDPASIEIRLEDRSGILESVGLLTRGYNFDVVTNRQTDNSQAATKGSVTINGDEFSVSESNPQSSIAGLSLSIRNIGETKIEVSDSGKQQRAPVVNFVANYNNAAGFFNATLNGDGAVANSLRLQSLRDDMVLSFLTPPDVSGKLTRLEDIGIIPVGERPRDKGQGHSQYILGSAYGRLLRGTEQFSSLRQTTGEGIQYPTPFSVGIDREKLSGSLNGSYKESRDLLQLAASQLGGRLDSSLNPDYGSITIHRNVIDSYLAGRTDLAVGNGDTSSFKREQFKGAATERLLNVYG